jgi:hypothetical protein
VALSKGVDEIVVVGEHLLDRARMVEQVCHIENYKKVVYQAEGRLLTAEEAAMEWISKYASQFPDPGPEGMR